MNRADAREDIIDRLTSGKTFNRVSARDIFDAQRDASDVECLDLLDGLLGLHDKSADALVLGAADLAKKARSIIERWVDAHPEWIEEHARPVEFEEMS